MNCKHIKHMAALLLSGSMLLSAGGCLSLEEESAGGRQNGIRATGYL